MSKTILRIIAYIRSECCAACVNKCDYGCKTHRIIKYIERAD